MARQIGPCPRRGGSRKARWLGPRSKRGGVPPPSPRHARRPRELRRARPRRATRTSVSRRAAASSTSASRQPAASAPAAALPLETGAANAKTAANASRSAPAAGAARGRAAANRMRARGIAGEPRGGWDPRASPPRGEATPKVVARGGSWPLRGAPRTPAPSRRPTGACEGGTPLNRPVSAARCARAAPGEARRTAWQQVRASGRGFSDPDFLALLVHKALFRGRYQARQLKIIRHAGREALDVIGRATLDASERRLALIAGEWYPRPSGSAKLGNAELRLIRNVQNNCGWPSLLVSVERAPLTLRWPCRT